MTYGGSQAFAGQGAQLQLAGTTVAEITKIQRSGSKMDIVDVTNMDSIGAYREKLPTLLDGGDISFDALYIPHDPTQQALQTQFDTRALGAWSIILPNALGSWAFNAYLTTCDFDLSVDKASTLSGKLAITGKPVYTP
jgi:predicted secreted protein